MENNNDNRLVLRENPNTEINSIEQPRQPRNVQDLLRYAIEVESLNTSNRTNHVPLDPERRQFLDDALSSMTMDVIGQLKKSLEVLNEDYCEGDSSEKFICALEQIVDFTDNIDVANDFYKMGGFEVCKIWLEKGPPEVKWRAANVIGECCQNNPFCQTKATETGLLKCLMDNALNDSDEMVKLKSFHAVSCIVRNNDLTLLNFLSLNGHKLIMNCLKSSHNKLKTKAAFFTSAVANKEDMLLEQLWDIGVVDELISFITGVEGEELGTDVSCFEQCLSALLCLIKGSPNKVKNRETLNNKLSKIHSNITNLPEYQESVEFINLILKIIKED